MKQRTHEKLLVEDVDQKKEDQGADYDDEGHHKVHGLSIVGTPEEDTRVT